MPCNVYNILGLKGSAGKPLLRKHPANITHLNLLELPEYIDIALPPSVTSYQHRSAARPCFNYPPLSSLTIQCHPKSLAFPHFPESLTVRNTVSVPPVSELSKLKKLDIVFSYQALPIVLDALPASLESLNVVKSFQRITLANLPPSQTVLKTHDSEVNVDVLPPSIRKLRLDGAFNKPVNHLPSSLASLTFGDIFNCPVNLLPPSLTHIIFGSSFNQPITQLPQALTHIKFGNSFNQKVDALPPSLRCLRLGAKFNHPLGSLPSLTGLIIDFSFLFKQSQSLPSSLVHAHFGGKPEKKWASDSFSTLKCEWEEFALPNVPQFSFITAKYESVRHHLRLAMQQGDL